MNESVRTVGQDQFLEVIDRDEAERRLHAAIRLAPLGEESVPLDCALDLVLSQDVVAEVDVPCFDRSDYDGFAVRAQDTYGAQEEQPRRLALLESIIATGVVPGVQVVPGSAVSISTGAMVPRGADAILMVEDADVDGDHVLVRRAVTPGFGVTFAGTDVACGETILRRGDVLTSRETGILAAIGIDRARVWRRPRVAIVSTGDELIEPGQPMRPGLVYDSNARILADAVRELGGIAEVHPIVPDDMVALRQRLRQSLESADVVLLSGGTSKGAGDLCYRVVGELTDPGILVHGVALKPGKPICLAASSGKPVVVLPGFPTSAIFTFHEFIAPVLRRLAGRPAGSPSTVIASMAVKVHSEIGRTEYMLVRLVPREETASVGQAPFAAYPMGKGSGSVTTFSGADGFITIDRHQEILPSESVVSVQLLGRQRRIADLIVIGSHCIGLDYLLGQIHERGLCTKFLAVGSTAGLEVARRGECDVAGVHLLDPHSGKYNWPFLTPELELIEGYGRLQGVVFRPGDERFEQKDARRAIEGVRNDSACVMVNRNPGSGTRILIDQLLGGAQPNGYPVQARSHNAVAAAVKQGRADWGVAIEPVARQAKLGFLPLAQERFDFVVPRARSVRPAVILLRQLLADEQVRRELTRLGFAL
jgi:putative molybdopterin biosynthesis protein